MHQSANVKDTFERFDMKESNPVKTPLDPSTKLIRSSEDSRPSTAPYRELIGSLMYLAVAIRPDIAFAVSSLSQFNDCHDETHWNSAKRVLCYLKGTIKHGITFSPGTTPTKCFVDSDWASCQTKKLKLCDIQRN